MLTLAQIFDCAPSQYLISPPATGRSCISTKEGILLNYFRHLSSVECPGIEDSQVSGVGDILLKLYIMNIKNLSNFPSTLKFLDEALDEEWHPGTFLFLLSECQCRMVNVRG